MSASDSGEPEGAVGVERGHLYVVATPIGCLADLSPRAREVLQGVALICAEDTRHTVQLARLAGLRLPELWSLHEHNERERVAAVVARLREGAAAALVCDAGTPAVSDPGFLLVQAAALAEIPVHPVPGPCAAIAALSASGLPPEPFAFAGFFPKRGDLAAWLQSRVPPRTTTAIYVPARDLGRLGDALAAQWPAARVVIGRELTKRHERFYRGAAATLRVPEDERRGEAVVLVWREAAREDPNDERLAAQVEALVARGLSARDAVLAVSELAEVPRRRVQALAHRPK